MVQWVHPLLLVALSVEVASANLRPRFAEVKAIPTAPPLPTCPPTPPLPPRDAIVPLNDTILSEIKSFLVDNTVGPCTEGAHSPSSTGLSAAIVVGGHVRYLNSGCVSKDKPNTAPTNETIYRLASVTKLFAVETALQAVRDGKLASLDDELKEYFPDFYINNPFGSSQPTFRQMMSQLSGTPLEGPCDSAACEISTEKILPRIAKHSRLMMPPWSYPSYSNLGYSIFGNLIAERLYNMSWGDFVAEKLTKQLGMDSTGLNYTSSVLSRMPTFYLQDGSVAPFQPLGWGNPSGGMYSTSADMATWILHTLGEWRQEDSNGQFRRNMLRQIHENPDAETGFGAPWEIYRSGSYLLRTKSGGLPGLTSFIAMIPELDFGFVFLWNGVVLGADDAGRALGNYLGQILKDQYTQYQTENFPAPSNKFLSEYIGVYSGMGLKAVVNATEDPSLGNQLVAHVDAGPFGELKLRPMPSESDQFVFRIFYRRDRSACMAGETASHAGEWVFFKTIDNGTKAFSVPGIRYWVNFTAIN
eukprot:gb/GECG01005192.1/.p1 GENE.gb/GECG01005192.1/~~gb/GECG01005192.1/.p1  ORF type:complete len:529 (+),score=47.04 gb/GECG01005192.1/:1-1587(+)